MAQQKVANGTPGASGEKAPLQFPEIKPLEKKIEGPKLTPEQSMAISVLSGLIKKTDANLLKAKGKAEQDMLLSHLDKQYIELITSYNLYGDNLNVVIDELEKRNISKGEEHLDSSEVERVSAYDYLKKNYFPREIPSGMKNKN